MSDLGFNKIAFCVLGTGLLLIGLNEASHAFFRTEHHEKDAYLIELPEEAGGGGATAAVAEGPRDYGVLLAAADATAGKEVAVKCQQCHKFEPGAESLQGPPLFGVVGRDIASLDFKYSTGAGSLSELEGAWDYEKLDHFIERPKKFRPATAMNFLGVTKTTDRMNLIAYLRTLTSGEPLPLPAPLPPQATDAAVPAEGAVPTDPSAPAQGEAGAPAPATPAPGAPAAPAAPAPATPAPAQPTH